MDKKIKFDSVPSSIWELPNEEFDQPLSNQECLEMHADRDGYQRLEAGSKLYGAHRLSVMVMYVKKRKRLQLTLTL